MFLVEFMAMELLTCKYEGETYQIVGRELTKLAHIRNTIGCYSPSSLLTLDPNLVLPCLGLGLVGQ